MSRHRLSLLEVALASALATSPVLAGTLYHVVDLGPGTGDAIDNHGNVAGRQVAAPFSALTWRKKQATVLPDFGEGGFARAINGPGAIVGEAADGGVLHPVLWTTDGQLHDLGAPPPGDVSGVALGIDNAGEIVGTWQLPAPPWTTSFLVDAAGVMGPFPLAPGGRSPIVEAMNVHGQVVGTTLAPTNGRGYVCFIYGAKGVVDFGTALDWYSCSATAISSAGHVGGSVGVAATSRVEAFLWTGGQPQPLGVLPGDARSEVIGLNASDVVVGNSLFDNGFAHPFVWSEGVMTPLSELLDESGQHWSTLRISGINDAGEISGSGILNGKTEHAFILRPIAD